MRKFLPLEGVISSEIGQAVFSRGCGRRQTPLPVSSVGAVLHLRKIDNYSLASEALALQHRHLLRPGKVTMPLLFHHDY